jgi:hypothetical protein
MSEEQLEGQQDQTPMPEGESADYKTLYFEEIKNAKKQRARAQEAEAIADKYIKKQETFKANQLKEQEKFKELSETLQAQLDDASPYKEKWVSFEASRKEELLSKLPEGDREGLKDESLKTLEYITSKLEDSKPVNVQQSVGAARNINELPKENIFGLPAEERQKYWDSYMKDMASKKNI